MKFKLLFLLIIILVSCKSGAQQLYNNIVPVDEKWNYINNLSGNKVIPGGTYFKDVNGVFDVYTGIWIGSWDNKNYEFHITKNLGREYPEFDLKYDELEIRYKITDNSGNILANTLEYVSDPIYIMDGLGFYRYDNHVYRFNYTGLGDAECGDSGALFVKLKNNNSQLEVFIVPDELILLPDDDCYNNTVSPPFPLEGSFMTLDKQD